MADKKMKLTRDEVAKVIKRALPGTEFALHLQLDVVLADDDLQYYPGGNRTHIKVSRKDALKLVSDYLTDKGESEGRRIPLSVYEGDGGRPYTCIWIG